GDAWRGGFVAGLLMDYSIRNCLKLGNVMASFAIEKYGTVNHRPTRKEIGKRIKQLK
ncbi:carbohydrate kinase family protein, partial [Candidatus Roizmanbacteria bacterium CG07_land_8_20_14_0_80_34_15]